MRRLLLLLTLLSTISLSAPNVIVDSSGDGTEFRRLTSSTTSELVGEIDTTATNLWNFDLCVKIERRQLMPADSNWMTELAKGLANSPEYIILVVVLLEAGPYSS